MPHSIFLRVKGPIFEYIDQASRNRAAIDLDLVLRELRSRRNLVAVGKALGIVRTRGQEDHLRNDWFDEAGHGWWRHAQPVEPIFRRGLIKAVELVRDLDLPIDSYWVRTDAHREPVRVSISSNTQQITFLFHSPQPPLRAGAPRPRLAVDRSIWVAQRGKTGRVTLTHVKSPRVI